MIVKIPQTNMQKLGPLIFSIMFRNSPQNLQMLQFKGQLYTIPLNVVQTYGI